MRKLSNEYLSIKSYKNDEEEILQNMETVLSNIMQPHIERLAAISSKASISSSTNMLLTNFLLHRTTPKTETEKLDFFLQQIYLAGVNFVKANDGGIYDFMKDTNLSIEEAWNE